MTRTLFISLYFLMFLVFSCFEIAGQHTIANAILFLMILEIPGAFIAGFFNRDILRFFFD